MTPNPVTVAMDDTLERVRELFSENSFHHLLVVHKGELRGVLSDRDLLKSISHKVGTAAAQQQDMETLNRKAHQIMCRQLITVEPEDGIGQAVEKFQTHRITCLPVVNSEGRAMGILTWRDIMAQLKTSR
ncbi:MAG: CBS domain-containing protein [Lysobacterales bacterium]